MSYEWFNIEYMNEDVKQIWIKVIAGLLVIFLSLVLKTPLKILWNKLKGYFKKKKLQMHIFNVMRNQLKNQIKKQINSKKYIPQTFIEISDIKEFSRYFLDPVLFIRKAIDHIRILDFRRMNKKIKDETNVKKLFSIVVRFKFLKVNLKNLISKTYELIKILDSKKKELTKLSSKLDKNWSFLNINPSIWKIEHLDSFLKCLKSRVLLIQGNAGQGKTNFVCDLAHTFLYRKKIATLFYTGGDFVDIESRSVSEIIKSKTFNEFKDLDFNEILKEMSKRAYKTNKPVIIIIDGINENIKPGVFSAKLEQFIESILNLNFVRVVITCRSDFYNHNFSNIDNSSFSKDIYEIKDLQTHMTTDEKEKLFWKYINYFKIKISSVWHNAYDSLVNDFLILRIFSEVYEGQELGDVYNIYKEELFKRYFEVKRSVIKATSGIDIELILTTIAKKMFETGEFVNIEIDSIIKETEYTGEMLDGLIHDSVLVRKDLKENTSTPFKKEVISFTFDEFRDYFLTYYLLEHVFVKSEEAFDDYIEKYFDQRSVILEGAGRFIFYVSRKKENWKFFEKIKEKQWFKDKYIDNLFTLNDDLLTNDDVIEVKRRFDDNYDDAIKIFKYLMNYRYDKEVFKKLNIESLFEFLKESNPERVKTIFDKMFYINKYGYNQQLRDFIMKYKRMIFNNDFNKDAKLHVRFNIIVFTFMYVKNLSFEYNSFYIYRDYIKKYPTEAKVFLKSFLNVKHPEILYYVKKLIKEVE